MRQFHVRKFGESSRTFFFRNKMRLIVLIGLIFLQKSVYVRLRFFGYVLSERTGLPEGNDLTVQNHDMKSELVDKASTVIKDPQLLINIVSRRVAQLTDPKSAFRSPLVPTMPHTQAADIALMEIIEGKLSWRFEEPEISAEEDQKAKDAIQFGDGMPDDTAGIDFVDLSLDDLTAALDEE